MTIASRKIGPRAAAVKPRADSLFLVSEAVFGASLSQSPDWSQDSIWFRSQRSNCCHSIHCRATTTSWTKLATKRMADVIKRFKKGDSSAIADVEAEIGDAAAQRRRSRRGLSVLGRLARPTSWSRRWSREKVAETSMISMMLAERVSAGIRCYQKAFDVVQCSDP